MHGHSCTVRAVAGAVLPKARGSPGVASTRPAAAWHEREASGVTVLITPAPRVPCSEKVGAPTDAGVALITRRVRSRSGSRSGSRSRSLLLLSHVTRSATPTAAVAVVAVQWTFKPQKAVASVSSRVTRAVSVSAAGSHALVLVRARQELRLGVSAVVDSALARADVVELICVLRLLLLLLSHVTRSATPTAAVAVVAVQWTFKPQKAVASVSSRVTRAVSVSAAGSHALVLVRARQELRLGVSAVVDSALARADVVELICVFRVSATESAGCLISGSSSANEADGEQFSVHH